MLISHTDLFQHLIATAEAVFYVPRGCSRLYSESILKVLNHQCQHLRHMAGLVAELCAT